MDVKTVVRSRRTERGAVTGDWNYEALVVRQMQSLSLSLGDPPLLPGASPLRDVCRRRLQMQGCCLTGQRTLVPWLLGYFPWARRHQALLIVLKRASRSTDKKKRSFLAVGEMTLP